MNEQQKQDPKFAKFHGVDREKFSGIRLLMNQNASVAVCAPLLAVEVSTNLITKIKSQK